MNNNSDQYDTPQDLIFIVGPIGTPEEKKAYKLAIGLDERGDRGAPDELLEIGNEALRTFSGRSPEEASPLKELLFAIRGQEIGPVFTFVATGAMKGVWTPTLTIHLDRSEGVDGTPLSHLLQMDDGQVIAAMLGRSLKADWIYTTWIYPMEPVTLGQSEQEAGAGEVQ